MNKNCMNSKKENTIIKRILYQYISDEKKDLILATVLILISLFLELSIPVHLEKIINIFVYKQANENITIVIVELLLTFIVLAISEIHKNKIIANVTEKLGMTLRKKVFDGFVSMNCSDIDKYNHGDLMSRLVNDVEKISSVVELFEMSLTAIIMTIGTMIIMLYRSTQLAVISILTGLISYWFIKFFSNKMRDCYYEQQIELGALTTDIEEITRNKSTIDNTNSHAFFLNKIKKQNIKFKRIRQKTMIVSGVLPSIVLILGNMNCILLIFCGYKTVLNGILTVGALQTLVMYSKQFMESVNELGNVSIKVQSFFSGCKRIMDLLENNNEELLEELEAQNKKEDNDAILFKNVTFGYTKEKLILNNCTFKVEKNKKVVLVGHTGCGKSTILNLLTKLYEDYTGEIIVQGTNLKNINDTSLKRILVVSLQEPKIITGTVYENIIYGSDLVPKGKIKELIQSTDLDAFELLFGDGLDTNVSNATLSPNQKQIISILRVLHADPDIIVFDETLSGFDSNNNLKIKEKLIKKLSDKTIIFIGHDLENFKDIDSIYVLNDGYIEEQGTHDELIKSKKTYYRLFNSQQEGKDV